MNSQDKEASRQAAMANLLKANGFERKDYQPADKSLSELGHLSPSPTPDLKSKSDESTSRKINFPEQQMERER